MKKTDFEHKKKASLAHQLIKAGRLMNERGLAEAKKAFHLPQLKQSHLDLFPYIDFEGTNISDIAKRKGVSKQSVSKLVQEMLAMKLLYLEVDAEDSRAKRIFFNTTGPLAIQKGFAALESIDRLLVEQLGEKAYKRLLSDVTNVIDSNQV